MTIAVLDSGIKWNDLAAMRDLRAKTRLNRGELEQPLHDRSAPTEPGADCAAYGDGWDANGDGVFNVLDYACDSRVDPRRRWATGRWTDGRPLLDPQDVLIAFSDGADDDANGFRDDIVGWDFLDDDNDPFDDVQYGHGTGEARDSTAEADNGGELGTCPNCMSIHMRVGDSFIADESDFAQAVLYAVDNDVRVVQEALGTLNHTSLGRDAVEYAYRQRRGGDRLGRGRGGAAPQLALERAAHDRGQLGHEVQRGAHGRAALLPPVQRLHELLVEDRRGDPERVLLLGRHGPRRRHGRA